MVEPQAYSYEDHRKIAYASKSFTGVAVLTLFLYFIFWIPGLIANIMFYKEAREVRRVTGHAPAGMGLLSFMFWASLVPFLLLIVIVIPAIF